MGRLKWALGPEEQTETDRDGNVTVTILMRIACVPPLRPPLHHPVLAKCKFLLFDANFLHLLLCPSAPRFFFHYFFFFFGCSSRLVAALSPPSATLLF